jgi:seryl-tRNA synthetase
MIAILENFQDAGGAVSVPTALTDFGAPPILGVERLRRNA